MALIDDLVRQFSDPMAFFRELVQNSIDSGTGEVEIDVRHVDGNCEVLVRDWGEGMSREIIETKLVRLFASGKDDDLTKIGRFGIGFVSVFAIEPDQVIVETGRSGHQWRVVFAPDRTYQLFRLPHPMEGTEIRIVKEMSAEDFQEFRRRARKTIEKWCKFAEIPVYFGGEPTAQAFDVAALCKVTYEAQGTRIVMGIATDDEEIQAGYYNRGLTLMESEESPWPWASFRIDSHLLEHTLTRDQLLRDRNLDRATEILEGLATRDLPQRLIDSLEELAASPGVADREAHELHLSYLLRYIDTRGEFPREWQRRQILRTSDGEVVDLRRVRRALADGKVLLTQDNCAIAQAMEKGEVLLLQGGQDLRLLLRRLYGKAPRFVESDFLLLDDLRRAEVAAAGALKAAVFELLQKTGQAVDEVLFVDPSFHVDRSLRESPFFSLPTTSEPIPRKAWMVNLGAGTTLALNYYHDLDGESYETLAKLAQREPEWAAMVVVDSLRISGEIDERLLNTALAMRMERL